MKNYSKSLVAAALICAAAPAAMAYELKGGAWRENQVSINYYPQLSDATLAGKQIWNDAMSEAVDAWTQGTSGLQIGKVAGSAHPCAGTGTPTIAPGDGEQVGIGFFGSACGEAWGEDVLAVNISYSSGGFYDNSDIVFNDAISWDLYSGPARAEAPATYDFKRIAIHELGHLFGLGHEEANLSVMHPSYANVELPSPDDFEGLNALYSVAHSPLLVQLEEPSFQQVSSGVSNIRGYAVADVGIEKVEIYIDNVLWGNSPYGSQRADVGEAFPSHPNSGRSGFSLAYNWASLEAGPHTVIARAYDKLGNISTDSGLALVEKFAIDFIPSAKLVKLAGSVKTEGDTITLDDVVIDGKPYRVVLKWSTPSQQFDILNIINLF